MFSAHPSRIKGDLLLLLVAAVWGSAFVAQRVASEQISAFTFNGLRFWLGALCLVPVLRQRLWRPKALELKAGGLAGLLLFCAAALQQAGIKFTTAGKAGFITGLYVVLVPILLALLWRQRLSPLVWLASAIGLLGLYLLSDIGVFNIGRGESLILIGAVVWALHVIVISRFAPQIDPLVLASWQFIVCGALSLAAGLCWDPNPWAGLNTAWWTILYTGVFSVALGYTLQVVAQRFAPSTDAAIILSSEAVFAVFWGWLFLNESLTSLQLVGCGLMLTAIIIAHWNPLAKGLPTSKHQTNLRKD